MTPKEYRKARKQEVKSLIAYLKYQCLKGNVTLDEALRNLGYKRTSVDELDCSTCLYKDSPCTLNDYINVNEHCSHYKKEN